MIPSVFRSSGQKPMPWRMAFLGEFSARVLPPIRRCPPIGPVRPEQQPRRLGPAGTQQTGQAQDLALPHLEVEGRHGTLPAEGLDFDDRRAPVPGRRLPGGSGRRVLASWVTSRPIICSISFSLGQIAGPGLAHQLAVPQHGDAVRQLVGLVQEVGHEEDGQALRPAAAGSPGTAGPPRARPGLRWARPGSGSWRRCPGPGRWPPSAGWPRNRRKAAG